VEFQKVKVNWFLSLFPQYRELQRMLREEADRATELQDQNLLLTQQNHDLVEDVRSARSQQDMAHKTVANVFAQLAGHLPPFREAYTIERRPESGEPGPIPTNRIYARDAVAAGKQAFREQLSGLSKEAN
jgi:hypothetical protein